MKKYVWLNINTGQFSNSWTEEEHKQFNPLVPITESGWKLIEYNCINDNSFKFYDLMKIQTNITK